MIKILKTSPCYLTTNQSECSWADQAPKDPTHNAAFKNPCLKAMKEFRSFEC